MFYAIIEFTFIDMKYETAISPNQQNAGALVAGWRLACALDILHAIVIYTKPCKLYKRKLYNAYYVILYIIYMAVQSIP